MIDYNEQLPVSKRSNDKTWSVSKVFIWVFELSITNVCKAFGLVIVPSMTQLTQPQESLSVFNLLWYQFGDYISSMYINCANCHDLLPVSRWKISNQHVDQRCQLLDLIWRKAAVSDDRKQERKIWTSTFYSKFLGSILWKTFAGKIFLERLRVVI